MKIGEAFPSKWLKAADLGGRKIGVTIDSVEMANIGDDQDKLVVYFQGQTKGFVLNVTNANMIAEIAGTDETDDWTGVKITLYSTKVDYAGKRVDAIRVDYPAQPATRNGQRARPLVTRATPPPREPGSDDVVNGPPLDNDDVPW